MKWTPVTPDTEFQDGRQYWIKWRFGIGVGVQVMTYRKETDTFTEHFTLERHEVEAYYDDRKPIIIH